MTKQELRQEIRRRKAACSTEERAALSRVAIANLLSTPEWLAAETILLYHSLPDEVNTDSLIRHTFQHGKRIILPAVTGYDLELREYCGEEHLVEGAFHIQEPVGDVFTDYFSIDLAVIPGVAFTPAGARLGRGRGYYDRLLPRLVGTYKIGLCWNFQIVKNIPVEPHDVLMDSVVC